MSVPSWPAPAGGLLMPYTAVDHGWLQGPGQWVTAGRPLRRARSVVPNGVDVLGSKAPVRGARLARAAWAVVEGLEGRTFFAVADPATVQSLPFVLDWR